MQITIGKVLARVIAVGYAIVAFRIQGMSGLKCSAGILFPLSFIWFPDEIGNLTGHFRSGYVNVQTPAVVISFLGWSFLVGSPILLYRFLK